MGPKQCLVLKFSFEKFEEGSGAQPKQHETEDLPCRNLFKNLRMRANLYLFIHNN